LAAELGSVIYARIQRRAEIRERHLRLLWGSLFALIMADGIITELAIDNSVGYEANPFLTDMLGSMSFFLFKLLGAIVVILFLRNVSIKHYRVGIVSSCIAVLLYTVIVFWNVLVCHLVMF
jgi:hypothetical protein